jgi:hypothetical protein
MPIKIDGTNGVLQAYDYQVLTTGFTYTFAAGVQLLLAVPAGTLATGTVTMPASPVDGMNITITSTQQITALTVNGNTGQSVVGGATSVSVGGSQTFVYRLANTTWYSQNNNATSFTLTTAAVGTASAGFSAGDVGTYAFLHLNTTNTSIATGSTRAGSGLVYASIFPWTAGGTSTAVGQAGSGAPSGTWRCMGQITAYDNANYRGATLWLRIS